MHNFREQIAAISAAPDSDGRYLYKSSRSASVFALAILAAVGIYLLTWFAYAVISALTTDGVITQAPNLVGLMNHLEVHVILLCQHYG